MSNHPDCVFPEPCDCTGCYEEFKARRGRSSPPEPTTTEGPRGEEWHDGLPYAAVSVSEPKGRATEWMVPLWDSVWYAARSVGGDPEKHTIGVNGLSRETAVNQVTDAVHVAMKLALETAALASPAAKDEEVVIEVSPEVRTKWEEEHAHGPEAPEGDEYPALTPSQPEPSGERGE